MRERRDGGGLVVMSIVLVVTFVAMLIGLYWLVSEGDRQARMSVEQCNSPEIIRDEDAAEVSPYRMHYAYEWTDDDLAGGYSDNVAAASILLKANSLNVERDTLAASIVEDADNVEMADVLNHIVDSTYVAVPIAYDYIQFLPAPSIIWIAEDDGDIRPVVFLCAEESVALVSDPRNGITTYPFSVLSDKYVDAGRQAVCMADRGYTALTG